MRRPRRLLSLALLCASVLPHAAGAARIRRARFVHGIRPHRFVLLKHDKQKQLLIARKSPRLRPTINSFAYHAGGVVLSNVRLTVMYWGKNWNTLHQPTSENPRPANANSVAAGVRSMIAAGYVPALSEYAASIGAGSIADQQIFDNYEPPSSFNEVTIEQFVVDRILDHRLRGIENPNHLFLIVMPEGAYFPADGEHWAMPYTDAAGTSYNVHLGFVRSDGYLDDVTVTLSHELVEAVSDAEMNAVWGSSDSCNAGESGKPQCEIADACQYGESATLADGTVVAKYWSQKQAACIAPQ